MLRNCAQRGHYDGLEAMPATVRLNDIVALEMQFDESPSYLDLDTGQVVTVSEDLLREADVPGDEEPDLPDWQKDEWEIAKRTASTYLCAIGTSHHSPRSRSALTQSENCSHCPAEFGLWTTIRSGRSCLGVRLTEFGLHPVKKRVSCAAGKSLLASPSEIGACLRVSSELRPEVALHV